MAAENGFTIQGKVYEPPDIDGLTNDENEVLWECAQVTQEDFGRREDESEDDHTDRIAAIVRHPGFMRAWMHIAFQRGNPQLSKQKVAQIIGKTNRLEALATLAEDQVEEEAPDVPLASTREPSAPSRSGPLSSDSSMSRSGETPGNGSGNGSDSLGSHPSDTGELRSATSPILAQEISAA